MGALPLTGKDRGRVLRIASRLVVLSIALVTTPNGFAQQQVRIWVDTWTTAPVSAAPSSAGLKSREAAGATVSFEVQEQTLREFVHVSLGGETIRLVLSNEFGTDSLKLTAVRVRAAGDASGSDASGSAGSSDKVVLFAGKDAVVIPPGALMISDATSVHVAALTDLIVTMHLSAQVMHTATWHSFANQTNFVLSSGALEGGELPAEQKVACWTFLKGVQVQAESGARTIVAFGDSITDGVHSTKNRNARWPDVLAARLVSAAETDRKLRGTAVANEGIGGNRILENAAGPNGLARFDRDVLAQAGARYVIVFEGINDIGNMPGSVDPHSLVEAMIAGYRQMIERAHARGMLVYGSTLTPYEGAAYATPSGESVRQSVNDWIRDSGAFDAVIDFDKITRDPEHPTRLLPAYDPGDHLHPNDEGYKTMANYIDLRLFH